MKENSYNSLIIQYHDFRITKDLEPDLLFKINISWSALTRCSKKNTFIIKCDHIYIYNLLQKNYEKLFLLKMIFISIFLSESIYQYCFILVCPKFKLKLMEQFWRTIDQWYGKDMLWKTYHTRYWQKKCDSCAVRRFSQVVR